MSTADLTPRVERSTLDQLVNRARQLAHDGAERGRSILGIAGAPGAGKSTLAQTIVDALGHDLAVLVPMDGFHLANSVLIERGYLQVKGAIHTFDDAGYANLLGRIARQSADEIIYAPHFDRDLEESIAGSIPILSGVPLVVTEGNYLLSEEGRWPHARRFVTESWFLEPEQRLRHNRLIQRHMSYGKTEEEARHWSLGSDEDNARLITRTAVNATKVIRLAD